MDFKHTMFKSHTDPLPSIASLCSFDDQEQLSTSPRYLPSSPSSSPPPPSSTLTNIIVYFFCIRPDHNPTTFITGRNYECTECPARMKGFYYCTECEFQQRRVRHYAAHHINNHVNNLHGGRTVKRLFAANSEHGWVVQEYKESLISNKKLGKQYRVNASVLRRSNPYPMEHKFSNNQQSLCDLMKIPHSLMNTEPPKLPIAHKPPPPFPLVNSSSMPLLPSTISTPDSQHQTTTTTTTTTTATTTTSPSLREPSSEYSLRRKWAQLINLGAMGSFSCSQLRKMMDSPEDKEQVISLEHSFNTFLGHAMEIFYEDSAANAQLNRLASVVATALSSGEKITPAILNEFKVTADVLLKDLMEKGCGNFLLLGFLLTGDLILLKNIDPKIFLNGMFFTLNLPFSSRTFEFEKLFDVLNEWCLKYGVKLNGEIMDMIKRLTKKRIDE